MKIARAGYWVVIRIWRLNSRVKAPCCEAWFSEMAPLYSRKMPPVTMTRPHIEPTSKTTSNTDMV